MIQRIIINFGPGNHVRHETMEGRDYLVAPMVMLTEGVHLGSNGPLFYPEKELKKFPESWNHKPVVIYHPTENGQGISACDQSVIEARKVGIIMNTRWDGKLRAEAWMEKDALKRVDDRVLTALEKGEVMELSTGVFTENEEVRGEWNGEEYYAVARNYRPDHLAILPDKIGACSVKDGAGLLQLNSEHGLSHGDIFNQLWRLLQERLGDNAFVEAVFDAFVIYQNDDKLFSLNYTIDNDVVKLGDDMPEEVVRVTEFRTLDGDVVGNVRDANPAPPKTIPGATGNPSTTHNHEGDNIMDKTKVIEGLISNEKTRWTEEDRKFLTGLEEDQLGKLEPMESEEKPPADPPVTPPKGETPPADPPTPEGNEEKKPVTADEYVANAPPEIREMLDSGLASCREEKQRLIGQITANEANEFTPEFLAEKSLEEIRLIAKLAVNQNPQALQETTPETPLPSRWVGSAGSGAPMTNASKEEALVAPTMNFGKEEENGKA